MLVVSGNQGQRDILHIRDAKHCISFRFNDGLLDLFSVSFSSSLYLKTAFFHAAAGFEVGADAFA